MIFNVNRTCSPIFACFGSAENSITKPAELAPASNACTGVGVLLGTGVDVPSKAGEIVSSSMGVEEVSKVGEGVLEDSGVGVSVFVGDAVGVSSCKADLADRGNLWTMPWYPTELDSVLEDGAAATLGADIFRNITAINKARKMYSVRDCFANMEPPVTSATRNLPLIDMDYFWINELVKFPQQRNYQALTCLDNNI
jgi:hypothetical protein